MRALIDASPSHWPRYELIGGELVVTPAPAGSHQLAVRDLLLILIEYLRREPVGTPLTSPADLELQDGTITQPDVFVIPAGGAPSTGGPFKWSDVGSLLLAIEVISPGSARTDRIEKREFYLDVGVPDYLIVDVDARVAEHWSLSRDTPMVLRDEFVWHPHGAREPLIISLPKLFDGIAATLRFIAGEGPRRTNDLNIRDQ